MGSGDRQFTVPPRAGRLAAPQRLLALALLGGAVAGCSGAANDPAEDLPPLPRDWQGSIQGPQPEAWASAWPREWSLKDATLDAATLPYVVPRLPASEEPPAELPTPPVRVRADKPAVEQQIVATATPGILLPPEPVFDSETEQMPPAADDAIAEERPTPAPPSAEASSPAQTALQFPPEPGADATNAAAASTAALDEQPSHRPSATAVSPGAPTGAIVNERATARIRRGFELAERGAYFAARNQFVDVLRMIASAKDQVHGSPRRTLALAEGLQALDEAADFSPLAPERASDLHLSVIVASHQTPVAKSLAVDDMLPEQLADAYLEFAGRQLGAAVAGEPTGSMALHALGKLHSRLGRVEPEKNPQADRTAFALQQAALLARSDNHMAAHELGVLLAEGGHYAESSNMLEQVALRAPHAVVFRNLARVEQQLGRPDLAAACQRQAEFLAARGDGGNANVEWVPAAALARTPDPMAPPAAPMMVRGPAPARR